MPGVVARFVGGHPVDHRFGDATRRHAVCEPVGKAEVSEVVGVYPDCEEGTRSGDAVQFVERPRGLRVQYHHPAGNRQVVCKHLFVGGHPPVH